jgi:hypothetical protein
VVLEQLGDALKTEKSKILFYNDFLRLQTIVRRQNEKERCHSTNSFLPLQPLATETIAEDEVLHNQQIQLSAILEASNSYEETIHLLKTSCLAHSDWKTENWEPYMLETAVNIAQKWKK